MTQRLVQWIKRPWRHVYELCWPVEAFKSSVAVLLKHQRAFLLTVSESLHEPHLDMKNAGLTLMQAWTSDYPEWVFSRGFNINLRASFRFFLLQIDRLTDLVLANQHVYEFVLDKETRVALSPKLKQVIQRHLVLFDVLIYFFETGQWSSEMIHEDDLAMLQADVEKQLGWNIEVMLWLQQQKDVRDVMLRLVMALPV